MTHRDDPPLRVGIDARLTRGLSGGVEQVLIGLAHGLSQLHDSDDEYVFLTLGKEDWLLPYLAGRCRALPAADEPEERSRAAAALLQLPWLARIIRNAPAVPGLRRPGPRPSDGTIEAEGADVMHFAIQDAFLTDLPSIYQPHDLQHLHLPQFFTPREREHRERTYRTHCGRAAAVVVMTQWGKQDLVDRYGLPPEKVHVIPWAPVLDAYEEPPEELIAEVSARLRLPERFAFYPAKTYPHKNHLALLQAVAILRDDGVRVPLICTGGLSDFQSRIRREIARLRLEDQVVFLGYLAEWEMRVLYRKAHCLVFPTLFEGWGMPVFEAFVSRLPVACSNIEVLQELVGDAAILFDPHDPEAIAHGLRAVWDQDATREALLTNADRRMRGVSWRATALKFRALYRSVAGRALTPEDEQLLDA